MILYATLRYFTLPYGTLRYFTLPYGTLRYLALLKLVLCSFVYHVVSPRQYCLNVFDARLAV